MRIMMSGLAVLLSSLCVPLAVAAAQTPAQTPAQLVVDDSGTHRSDSFGFQLRLPASMGVDTILQKIFDGPRSIPMAHSWAFLQAPAKSDANPHWQRVLIDAVMGVGIGEAAWNAQAARMLRSMSAQAPGGEVTENDVHWRADRAEYRLAVHDVAKGEFINKRCLGSMEGRQRSSIVCVLTAAPTADALAAVRESLVLTAPQAANERR